jgi:asparagine N-glycosylation enzyme membrane subunit Stt3
VWGLLHRSKPIVLVLSFPVVYFVFISRYVVRNERTILPLTPFLFLLAAIALVLLLDRLRMERNDVARKLALVAWSAILAVALLAPAAWAVRATINLTRVNSRETARVWVDANLSPGSVVAIEAYSPFVDPARFKVQGFSQITENPPDWYAEQGFDYLVFGEGMYGRFYADPERYAKQIAQYNAFFERFPLVRLFRDGGYEVRVYEVPR